jgi:uncharacterized protein (DUF433 family)
MSSIQAADRTPRRLRSSADAWSNHIHSIVVNARFARKDYRIQARIVPYTISVARRESPARLGDRPMMHFDRITADQRVMAGVPCIRGLRIPVATVVGMVADGMSVEEILSGYPDLEREDIVEALRFAAEAVRERSLPLVTVPS